MEKRRRRYLVRIAGYVFVVLGGLLSACGNQVTGAGDARTDEKDGGGLTTVRNDAAGDAGTDAFGWWDERGLQTNGQGGFHEIPLCEQSGDPCDGQTGLCFEVCGTEVLVLAPPILSGFSAARLLPEEFPFAVARSKGGLVSVEDSLLVVREAESLIELGRLPVGWAHAVVVVGTTAFVRDNMMGGITVVKIADPANPVPLAWWAAATTLPPSGIGGPEARVRLVGASNGRLVLSTERGVSLLDVSEPYAPVEDLCIAHAGGKPVWTPNVLTDGRWLVVQILTDGDEQAVARVHDLLAPDPTVAVAELSCLAEGLLALHKGRLLLAVEGEAQLYELAAHGELAMVAARAMPKVSLHGPASVVGGFLKVYMGKHWSALDLESDNLAIYVVQQENEAPCLERLLPEEEGPEWVVSPWYVPDQRWPAAQSPVHPCPATAQHSPLRALDGLLSPGGNEMLVQAEEGDWLVNLDDGTATPVSGLSLAYTEADFPRAVWVGNRIAMLAGGPGTDWEIMGDSYIEIHDRQLLDAPPLVVDSPGTILDLAAGDRHLFVLSEPAERLFEDPAPPIEERLVWSVDLGEALPSRTDVSLAGGAAPVGIAATGETLYVLDADAGIRILDSGGKELRTVAVPADSLNGPHIAGPEGLLVRGTDGVPRWLPPDSESFLDHVSGCTELVPVAATDGTFYLLGRSPHGSGFAYRWDLLVATPVHQDDGFVLEVQATAPLGRIPTRVFPGSPAVIVDTGLLLLL